MRPAQPHPADDDPTIETSVPTAQFLAQLASQEDLVTPSSAQAAARAPDSDKTITASSDMMDALTSNARRTDPPPNDAVTVALPPLLGPLEQPVPTLPPVSSFRPTSAPIPFVPLVPPGHYRGSSLGARVLGGVVAVAYAALMMKLLWLASGWIFHR
jgi:hypothetical protein